MIQLIPLEDIPLVHSGDSLAHIIVGAVEAAGHGILDDDILVVAQKIVSKAEGRSVLLREVQPSESALELAAETEKDPRLVELILSESKSIVRKRPGLIIAEDNRGLICANAGIDRSNVEQEGGETVLLLPENPDASAARLRDSIGQMTGRTVGVIINDSHGRAFRHGSIGVAIGIAGLPSLSDRRGDPDLTGFVLQHTVVGLADEIAAAASLLMGPAAEGVPGVVVRGLSLRGNGKASEMLRPHETDLFR